MWTLLRLNQLQILSAYKKDNNMYSVSLFCWLLISRLFPPHHFPQCAPARPCLGPSTARWGAATALPPTGRSVRRAANVATGSRETPDSRARPTPSGADPNLGVWVSLHRPPSLYLYPACVASGKTQNHFPRFLTHIICLGYWILPGWKKREKNHKDKWLTLK